VPALHPPVEAPIVRPFSYGGSLFAGGHHRGVDFAAAVGELVLAPCSGRVAFAGGTPSGPAVTLECAGRRLRVTLLPVRARRARAGRAVDARDIVGSVAGARDIVGSVAGGTHAGLHLGVRRAGDPLGYLDPAPLLAASAPPLGPAPPPSARRPSRRAGPRPPGGAGARTSVPLAGAPAQPAAAPASDVATMAPWPVWAGLALVLLGAVGTAGRRGRRRRAARRAPHPAFARRE